MKTKDLRIYVIAGESSGDFIGAKIIQEMKLLDSNLTFECIGGSLIEKAIDKKSLFPIQKINMMGFLEILPHIWEIRKLIGLAIKDILHKNPNILITIDSPGFTYRVAQKIRMILPQTRIVHIVAPSVWAYKADRAAKYAKIYDMLLALLPFEPPYFTSQGLNCVHIGHPILEQDFYLNKKAARAEYSLSPNAKIISVTAGSRKSEILQNLPIFCDALTILKSNFEDIKVIFVLADKMHEELYLKQIERVNFEFILSYDKLKAFGASDISLAKSGTNTLEISASKTPMIVCYKINPCSYAIIRRIIKVKYISLVNIVADKSIIPELIQSSFTATNLAACATEILIDPNKGANQVQEALKYVEIIGGNQKTLPSSRKAAELIISLLNQ
jgi:lipid-A-disaccharide synthase